MISRPTLAELYARWIADVQSRIEGASAAIRRSVLAVLGAALTAAIHSLYALAQEIGKQSVPYTATGTQLEGWASLWGLARRSAGLAIGTAVATGTPGAEVPADAKVFHAGTADKDGQIVTSGGRVLCVCALGNSVQQAQLRAYQVVEGISWEGSWQRSDIGHRAIRREQTGA